MKIAVGNNEWDIAGKRYRVLGSSVFVEQWWTPVVELNDNDEDCGDPEFVKMAALHFQN